MWVLLAELPMEADVQQSTRLLERGSHLDGRWCHHQWCQRPLVATILSFHVTSKAVHGRRELRNHLGAIMCLQDAAYMPGCRPCTCTCTVYAPKRQTPLNPHPVRLPYLQKHSSANGTAAPTTYMYRVCSWLASCRMSQLACLRAG